MFQSHYAWFILYRRFKYIAKYWPNIAKFSEPKFMYRVGRGVPLKNCVMAFKTAERRGYML